MDIVVMKKLVYIFCIVVFCYSCDKPNEEDIEQDKKDIELGTDKFLVVPLQKILDEYHVTTIAFDSKENAWIGTFKQGLIRYNAEETVFYNSENSIIPEGFSVSDIAIDKNDNVWIAGSGGGSEEIDGIVYGGSGGGLLKYDGREFTLYNKQNTLMPLDRAAYVEVDSKNNVWLQSWFQLNILG